MKLAIGKIYLIRGQGDPEKRYPCVLIEWERDYAVVCIFKTFGPSTQNVPITDLEEMP